MRHAGCQLADGRQFFGLKQVQLQVGQFFVDHFQFVQTLLKRRFCAPTTGHAPQVVAQQLQGVHIRRRVGSCFVAHAQHHANALTFDHGHRYKPLQMGVSIGQPFFDGVRGVVIHHHGCAVAEAVGPDAR